jgi:hypothetical protein
MFLFSHSRWCQNSKSLYGHDHSIAHPFWFPDHPTVLHCIVIITEHHKCRTLIKGILKNFTDWKVIEMKRKNERTGRKKLYVIIINTVFTPSLLSLVWSNKEDQVTRIKHTYLQKDRFWRCQMYLFASRCTVVVDCCGWTVISSTRTLLPGIRVGCWMSNWRTGVMQTCNFQ